MKTAELKTKWWYRLLKVIYYFFYITSLILGILIFPIIIIIFELLRGTFFYVVTGEGNFKFDSQIWKLFKKGILKINILKKDKNSFGLSRLKFNLILFFINIPIFYLGFWLLLAGFNTEQLILGGLILILGLIIFLYISINRFHNFGSSGWSIIGLFIPLINVILFFQLMFSKEKEVNKKLKKEKKLFILGGVLLVLILIITFYVQQFKNLGETVELLKNEKVYSKAELLEQAREQNESLKYIPDDELIESIKNTHPNIKTDF